MFSRKRADTALRSRLMECFRWARDLADSSSSEEERHGYGEAGALIMRAHQHASDASKAPGGLYGKGK